jgi:beta-lactamase regulating signal transducer with metallopeptidase domain
MDLDLFVRVSTLLLTALFLTRVLSRATAATRHLIWHAAVVAVLLAPAARLIAPRFTVVVPSWMSASFAQQTRDTVSVRPAERCDRTAASQCSPGEEIQSVPSLEAFAAIASTGAWIVGAWFLLGWFASTWQTTRATDAPAEWVIDARRLAARMGLSYSPALRQARDPGSPRVAGFFRPVILVPSSAHEWAASDREAALVHELSHIRRSDRRTQACAQLVCALYWFNPLTWIAARALARERERACDDAVLSGGIRPSSYASLLLDLAKGEQAWTAAAALGMARPSTIEGRLLAILATDTGTTSTSRRRLSPKSLDEMARHRRGDSHRRRSFRRQASAAVRDCGSVGGRANKA